MHRHIPRRTCRVALIAVVVGGLLPAAAGRSQPPACRDGECEPHCPVRPGQFGFYPTQWRRWPGGERPTETPRNGTTPATPPPSVVPRADEESPGAPEKAAPTSAAFPVPAPAAAPAADGRRLERLRAEADAARLKDPAARHDFTTRLVAAILSEPDPEARCGLLALAAGFDTPAAESICIGALDDPDPQVRLMACRVCAERRGPDIADRLDRLAREDADLGVRLRAVRCLGDLGDAAAIPRLVALLEDPDPAIQSRATAALGRATGRNFGADVDRWRKWAAQPEALPPTWSIGTAIRGLF